MRWLRILLLVLVSMFLASCVKKIPPAPSMFHEEMRVPTGDPDVELRISETTELLEITREEMQAIRDRMKTGVEVPGEVDRFVLALLVRGMDDEAVAVLRSRSLDSPADDGKAADLLSLLMGRLQWGACAELSLQLLKSHKSAGLFLVRSLCELRDGNPDASIQNLEAANATLAFDPDYLKLLMSVMQQRAAAGPLPPVDSATREQLLLGVRRRGALDRLAIAHLSGYHDKDTRSEIIDFRGLHPQDLKSVLASRNASYRYCYVLAEQEAEGRFKGHSELQFVINADGGVRDIEWLKSDWEGGDAAKAKVESCIAEQVSRLRFPAPRYGMSPVVRHKFNYVPVD